MFTNKQGNINFILRYKEINTIKYITMFTAANFWTIYFSGGCQIRRTYMTRFHGKM